MNREYITYELKEFILLGRKDTLNDLPRQTEEIINELKPLVTIKKLENILTNYYYGCRIGIIEQSLKNAHINVEFNKSNNLIYINNEGAKTHIISKKAYRTIKEKSRETARKVLEKR